MVNDKSTSSQICFVLYFIQFESLGNIERILARDYHIKFCHISNFAENAHVFSECELVIVLGGPIGVNDDDAFPLIKNILAGLEKRVKTEKFTLGICLGAQLIAKALGSDIRTGQKFEIGWDKIKLTAIGNESCIKYLKDVHVLHWHKDTFDLPRGCAHLASNETTENQAFAYGKRVMGIQFHFEVLPDFADFWTVGHFVELKHIGVDIKRLIKDFRIYAPQLKKPLNCIIRDFLKG